MKVEEQIQSYINSQSETKRAEMQVLYKQLLLLLPKCKLWFF